MFTGLVEELGRIKQIVKGASSVQISIQARTILADVKLGDSIAVNGTCLTVTAFGDDWFTADVMPETVKRTVLAELCSGDKVNLERTLRVGDRLGGHIVSGHIDGTGVILRKDRDDNAILVRIQAGPEVMRYVIEKGSVAIDGISLTVVSCGNDWFVVSLIPHTASLTTLGYKQPGQAVNLEADIIGKYVERLLKPDPAPAKQQGVSASFLAEHGFL